MAIGPPDIEIGPSNIVIGPSKSEKIIEVAQHIAENDDRTSIMFRRFDELAVANILELHSKMTRFDREPKDRDPYDKEWVRQKRDTIKQYRMYPTNHNGHVLVTFRRRWGSSSL